MHRKLLILKYLIKNYYRQSKHVMNFRLKALSPELEKYTFLILFFSVTFNISYPIVLATINADNIPYIDLFDSTLVIMCLFISSILLGFNIFKYKNSVLKLYDLKLFILNAIFIKPTVSIALISVNILCFKFLLYNSFSPMSIVFLTELVFLLIIVLSIRKDLYFDKIKSLLFIFVSIFIVGIGAHLINFKSIEYLNGFKINLENQIPYLSLYVVIVLLLNLLANYLQKRFQKFKNYNDMRQYIKLSPKYFLIIGLILIHFFKDVGVISNFYIELIYLLFFINVLFLKNKYFYVLSYESYQMFLFYLKNINYKFSKIVIGKIRAFFFVVGFDLLLCLFYLTLEGEANFASILLLLVFLDVTLGNMLTLIFPTRLGSKNRIQLIHYSKFQMSTTFILAIILGSFIQKTLMVLNADSLFLAASVNFQMLELFSIVSILLLILFTVYFINIWTKNYLDKLFIDKYESNEEG